MIFKVMSGGLAALLISSPAEPSAVQDHGIVERQFEMMSTLPQVGQTLFDRRFELGSGEKASFTVELPAGPLLVVGFCDENCTDLDLEATAPDGEEIDADRALDDTPQLGFAVTTGLTAVVTVSMAGCYAESCAAGFRIARYVAE